MLSQQTSNTTNLGPHRRQNSTPTKIHPSQILPTGQRQQREQHRRGLSLDQSFAAQQNHEYTQQNGYTTGVEHVLRQRPTQPTMREAQQQQQTARPGLNEIREQQYIAGRQQLQEYLMTNQSAPRQEPGHTPFTNDYPNTQLTDFEDQVQNLLNNAYKPNTMDLLQSFDSINTAGNLDGFGNELDGYTGDIQTNEIMNQMPMSYGVPNNEGSQRQSISEGSQRPRTPQIQTRDSE